MRRYYNQLKRELKDLGHTMTTIVESESPTKSKPAYVGIDTKKPVNDVKRVHDLFARKETLVFNETRQRITFYLRTLS